MKHTYSVQSFFIDKWVNLFTETRDFCAGYLKASQYNSPRNAYRLIRSDGKVIHELPAATEVGIGMVAGWPTPEQYEAAAQRATAQAARIREQQAKQEARRAPQL